MSKDTRDTEIELVNLLKEVEMGASIAWCAGTGELTDQTIFRWREKVCRHDRMWACSTAGSTAREQWAAASGD